LFPFIKLIFQNVWLHSLVIQIFIFGHITNIYLKISNKFMIIHFKIVPISVALCIAITSDKQIILIFLYPNRKFQISTLKGRIKTYLFLIFEFIFITLF